jgi:hypothetical protein
MSRRTGEVRIDIKHKRGEEKGMELRRGEERTRKEK